MSLIYDELKRAEKVKRARDQKQEPVTITISEELRDHDAVRPQLAQRTPQNFRLLFVYLVVTAIVATGLFEIRQLLRVRPSKEYQVQAPSTLGLKVERHGSDWTVSWDRKAADILTARRGRVLITDGTLHRQLDLDPSGLSSGSIVYTPVTDDVVLQLEIWNSESIPNSEFVHILGGQLPALVQQNTRLTPSLSSRSISPLRPTEKKEAPVKADGYIAGAQEAKPVAQAAIGESQATDQASRGTRTQSPETAVESSSIRAAVGPADVAASAPALLVKQELERQNDSRGAEGTQSASGVSTTVERGGKIQAAELISQTAPVYPAIAQRNGISGSVEVHFRIGADGKVHNASAVSGSPFFTRAAIDAVQAWRYKPAQLNGVAIDSDGTAIIEFTRK